MIQNYTKKKKKKKIFNKNLTILYIELFVDLYLITIFVYQVK